MMQDLIQALSSMPDVIQATTATVAIIVAIYGSIKGFMDIRDWTHDVKVRFRGAEYRVRTTIIKVTIKLEHTETIKLRTLRVFQKKDKLVLDPCPEILAFGDKARRRARLLNHFSVPGRTMRTQSNMFLIDLSEGERLTPGKDHSVVLGHLQQEKLQDLFGEPGIVATQPVGSECLVVEVHFPKDWCYKRIEDNKPKLEVYTEKTKGKKEDVRYSVEGDRFTFDREAGETDWFRVTIKEPPQAADINVDWFWEESKV